MFQLSIAKYKYESRIYNSSQIVALEVILDMETSWVFHLKLKASFAYEGKEHPSYKGVHCAILHVNH